MLKIVLLPDPFGPIRPRISPFSTPNDTLLTAVKPPKRLVRPWTASKSLRGSLRRACATPVAAKPARAAAGSGPDEIRLVVDVLQNHRERASFCLPMFPDSPSNLTPNPSIVPPSGRSTSSAALRSASASTPPYSLDGARQNFRHEHVGVARRHAHVRRPDLRAGPRFVPSPTILIMAGSGARSDFLVGQPDRDRIDVEEVVHIPAQRFLRSLS